MASDEAQKQGFNQILWLFGEEGFVTEAGASNFFVIWRNKTTNKLELVTAPLTDKLILDGVTRRSVLELARERLTAGGSGVEGLEDLEIVERKYTMDELVEAADEGRLVEGFAAGTAVSFSFSSR
jgi:branched-chain amino acid aminotransferase